MLELLGALIGTVVMAGLIALAYARYRWAPEKLTVASDSIAELVDRRIADR